MTVEVVALGQRKPSPYADSTPDERCAVRVAERRAIVVHLNLDDTTQPGDASDVEPSKSSTRTPRALASFGKSSERGGLDAVSQKPTLDWGTPRDRASSAWLSPAACEEQQGERPAKDGAWK